MFCNISPHLLKDKSHMVEVQRPINIHQHYHAHIYFDRETVLFATQLCEEIGEKFGLKIGRVHQKLVGPHTRWSCQIVFSQADFDYLIPWLDKQRNGLTVLVHGQTGDNLRDHTEYAYWLGESVLLDLSIFED